MFSYRTKVQRVKGVFTTDFIFDINKKSNMSGVLVFIYSLFIKSFLMSITVKPGIPNPA